MTHSRKDPGMYGGAPALDYMVAITCCVLHSQRAFVAASLCVTPGCAVPQEERPAPCDPF